MHRAHAVEEFPGSTTPAQIACAGQLKNIKNGVMLPACY